MPPSKSPQTPQNEAKFKSVWQKEWPKLTSKNKWEHNSACKIFQDMLWDLGIQMAAQRMWGRQDRENVVTQSITDFMRNLIREISYTDQEQKKYNETTGLPLYYGILNNKIADFCRKQSKLREVLVPPEQFPEFPFSPEDSFAGEVKKKLLARLARLPEEQRLVFELKIFHNLTLRAIALNLGISLHSVAYLFHQAKNQLLEALADLERN